MKHKIGVIGSAEGGTDEKLLNYARDMGREVAIHKCLLLTGATTGLSYEAVKGAKEVGGFTVGFSPASDEREHIEKYKLPTEYFDFIVFTGHGYTGRTVPFIKSSDAIIGIAGNIGTLREYLTAFSEGKVTGVLSGSGGASDIVIRDALEGKNGKKIFNSDPKLLVKEVIESLSK